VEREWREEEEIGLKNSSSTRTPNCPVHSTSGGRRVGGEERREGGKGEVKREGEVPQNPS
jgi:hypothetical protein